MLGEADSPPRLDGKLFFKSWERDVFGLALSLEGRVLRVGGFSANLIASIGRWEATECADQPRWDYYERFLEALDEDV